MAGDLGRRTPRLGSLKPFLRHGGGLFFNLKMPDTGHEIPETEAFGMVFVLHPATRIEHPL